MLKVKVPAIGNSMGILLPKEALAKLKSEKGDTLYLIESPEGYTITPYQQDFAPKVHQKGCTKRVRLDCFSFPVLAPLNKQSSLTLLVLLLVLFW